jgi:hypothetical protein
MHRHQCLPVRVFSSGHRRHVPPLQRIKASVGPPSLGLSQIAYSEIASRQMFGAGDQTVGSEASPSGSAIGPAFARQSPRHSLLLHQ